MRETLRFLEAEGISVHVGAGGVVVEGQHDAMSARARCAIETLTGRTAAVKRVLAEAAALSPEDRARLDREHEALAAMRAATSAPEIAPTRCPNGHARIAANAYCRPGHGAECKKCRAARVRVSKRKARTAAAKAKPDPKVKAKPGPPRRAMCASGLHALDEANTYTAADHRRRCRRCVRLRERRRCFECGSPHDREKRNHLSAPTPAFSGGE